MKKTAFIILLFVVAFVHILILKQKEEIPKYQAKKESKIIKIKLSQIAIQKEEPKKVEKLLPPKQIVLPPKPQPKVQKSKPILKKVRKKIHKKVKKTQKFKKIKKAKIQKSSPPKPKVVPITHQALQAPKPIIDNSALKRSYIAKIRELIKSNLYYPRVAKRMRIEGVVKVSFVINKDGTISSIDIKSGSKRILNQGALKTLKSIKAPPIPEKLGVGSLDLFVPIEFKIGG